MRSMVAAAFRSLSSPEFAQNRNECGVEYRNEKDQDRNCKYRENASRTASYLPDHYRAREEKPDEHRSAIAHKDRSRIEIEYKEADQGAYEDRDKCELSILASGS